MQTEILSAKVGIKWVAFKEGADLSELEDEPQKWVIEHRECTTETLIEVGEKIKVPAESHAFSLAYNLAFAEVHIKTVEGPKTDASSFSSEKPDRTFLAKIPTAILTSFVNRTDPTREVTQGEFAELKKRTPSGDKSTDSALS